MGKVPRLPLGTTKTPRNAGVQANIAENVRVTGIQAEVHAQTNEAQPQNKKDVVIVARTKTKPVSPSDEFKSFAPLGLFPAATIHAKYSPSDISARVNRGMCRHFSSLAGFIAQQPAIFVIFALVVGGGLLSGIVRAKKDVNFVQLFSVTTGQQVKDANHFEENFGGLFRTWSVVVSDESAQQSVIQKPALNAMSFLLTRIMREHEEDTTGLLDDFSLISSWQTQNDNQIALFSEIGNPGTVVKYTSKDFCRQAYVPTLLSPRTYNNNTATPNHIAYAYVLLNQCLTSRYTKPKLSLPEDWGIDRFPCRRQTILDCFQEGNYDFPLSLKQLEVVARDIAEVRQLSKASAFFGVQDPYKYCLDNYVYPKLTDDINALLDLTVSASQKKASQIVSLLDSNFVQLFSTWGYGYRKRYSLMSNSEIALHIQTALENEAAGLVSPASCSNGTICCVQWDGSSFSTPSLLGDSSFKQNGNDSIFAAGHMRSLSENFHHDHPFLKNLGPFAEISDDTSSQKSTKSTYRDDLVSAFEQRVIDSLLVIANSQSGSFFGKGELYSNITVNFLTWKSMNNAMDEATTPNAALISNGAVVTFLFMVYVAGKNEIPYRLEYAVYSRSLLNIIGTIIVFLSTMAGFGTIAILGIPLTPITLNTVPFLAIGLGLDDMLLMVHILNTLDKHQDNPLQRMRHAMGIAGPSVLVTTTINFGVFVIAGFNPIKIVQGFCYQMTVIIFVNKVLLLSLFLPCMYWDSLRVKARRTDLCVPPLVSVRKRPKEEAKFRDAGKHLQRWTEKFMLPLVENVKFQAFVLLAFVGMFVGMAWCSLYNMEVGLSPLDLTRSGSYQHRYWTIKDKYFLSDDALFVKRAISSNVSFPVSEQESLMSSMAAMQNLSWSGEVPHLRDRSWYARMQAFANLTDTSLQPITSASPFLQGKTYTNAFFAVQSVFTLANGVTFLDNFVCQVTRDSRRAPCSDDFAGAATSSSIHWEGAPWGNMEASFHPVTLYNMTTHDDIMQAIADTREVASDYAPTFHDYYMYGFTFAFYEQYRHMWSALFTLNGTSIIAVFVLTLLFEASARVALIQGLMALAINVEVTGLMTLMGIKLNAFSLVNLCVAIGLGVEFTAHVGYAYMMAWGTNHQRIKIALKKMMAPTVHGAFSSFFPLCLVAGNPYDFVRQYFFKMFVLAVWVSFLNGVIVLPVLLLLFGPPPMAEMQIVKGKRRAVSHSPLELNYIPPHLAGESGFAKNDRKYLQASRVPTMRPQLQRRDDDRRMVHVMVQTEDVGPRPK